MGTTLTIRIQCDHCKRTIGEIVDKERTKPKDLETSVLVVAPYRRTGGFQRPYVVCEDCEGKLFGDAEIDS